MGRQSGRQNGLALLPQMRRQNENADTAAHGIRGFSPILPKVQIYLCDPFQGRKHGRNPNARRLDAVQSERIGLCCVLVCRRRQMNDTSYALLTLFALAVFYGIYFAKMLAQGRRGIQTRQIGRRKESGVHTVEVLMGIAALCTPAAQLLSIVRGWSCLPANARFTGFLVAMIGDAVFLLSVPCMKDSRRAGIPEKDKTALVTSGIYQFSRNPAFLGFDLQYIGVFLLYCNPWTALCSAFAVTMLHLQILQEERYLHRAFGAPYAEYKSHVFRYLGRRSAS